MLLQDTLPSPFPTRFLIQCCHATITASSQRRCTTVKATVIGDPFYYLYLTKRWGGWERAERGHRRPTVGA